MKILITGASGFIGSAILHACKEKGAQVSCILRGKRRSKSWVESTADVVYYGDITDLSFMKRVISEAEPEVIYHMASSAIVRMCARDPVGAYQNNVMGTVSLLEAVRTSGDTVQKVVVSTSDKVYGHAQPPYDENTSFVPKYTYEATKACQDFACQNFFYNYDVPVVIARMGNIYGPGDPNDSRLIPRTIINALNDKPPVIYTDVADYQRDFIFIDDAVSAMMVLADKGIPGEAYCVGSSELIQPTIKEIVSIIMRLMQKNEEDINYPTRHSAFKEIEKQSIIADKIGKIGWKKTVSLEQGLKRTIEFYSNMQDGSDRS